MVIKNLTPKLQPVEVDELVGGRGYTLYVEGHGVTEIEGAYIPNMKKYEGIFEVLDKSITPNAEYSPEFVEEIKENEEKNEEDGVSPEEEKKSEPEVAEDKFVCEYCGAEFASARGLNSHKNRVHPEE